MSKKFNLVHVVTSEESITPLVLGQVFERAHEHAKLNSSTIHQVQVFIIAPFRNYFDKAYLQKVNSIKKQCPYLKIYMIGGVSRWLNFPRFFILLFRRLMLLNTTVYHCRSTTSLFAIRSLKKVFPNDKLLLDIRGYWPLERLYAKGIYTDINLSVQDQEEYDKDKLELNAALQLADGFTTINNTLKEYIEQNFRVKQGYSFMVPCCVSSVNYLESRVKIRTQLNLREKFVFLYLGGTQPYQHLEDMVFPFLKEALKFQEVHVLFITQNIDKMNALINQYSEFKNRYHIFSLPPKEVAEFVAAADMGMLLRKPNDVNRFAQPVKFGEYLSSGLPVLLQKGMTELSDFVQHYQLGLTIDMLSDNSNLCLEVNTVLEWLQQNKGKQSHYLNFVKQHYTWESYASYELKMYNKLLGYFN